jgi:hypothetical protein
MTRLIRAPELTARDFSSRALVGALVALAVVALLAGCRTVPPVDWPSRFGTYSFDDGIKEYGAPDRTATLSDGSRVCEWCTRKGYSSAYVTGYPTFPYTRVEVPPAKDEWMRLTFGPDNKLKEWKRFWR